MVVSKASSLNLSQVTFSDVKTDVHGRKMVYINQNGGKIVVQTPKMMASFGVKRWRKKDAIDNKEDKFELELSFSGENGTDKNASELREFHQKWKEFDEMIKDKIVEKGKEWLSMPKLDKNTLESVMYTPMVKVPKDKEGNELPYPSRIRVKIDREMDVAGNYTGRFLSNKRFKTEVLMYDESKAQVDFNEDNAEEVVPKNSQVVCLMELVYLSLSKTTISTKWKLVQAKVFRDKDTITGYAMLDDENVSHPDDLDTDKVEDEVAGEVAVEEAEAEVEIEVEVEVDDDADVTAEVDSDEEQVQQPATPKKGRAKRGVQA